MSKRKIRKGSHIPYKVSRKRIMAIKKIKKQYNRRARYYIKRLSLDEGDERTLYNKKRDVYYEID